MFVEHDRKVTPGMPPPGQGTFARNGDAGFRTGQVHVRDYLRVLYKRRWPSATILALVIGLSTLYNLTRVPMYQARVQLLIDASTENVVNFKQLVEQDKGLTEYYQTQLRLLKSRSLIKRTIDALKLPEESELTGGKDTRGSFARAVDGMLNPVATVRHFVTSRRASPAPPPTATDRESMLIDEFLARLSVSAIGESRLVDASFVARDPAFAARAINSLAEQYIQQRSDVKASASREALEWLGEKLGDQQKQVNASELAAQRYREDNNPLTAQDSQNIVVQKLAGLNAAVMRAKTDRIAKDGQIRQLDAARASGAALDELPVVASSPVVQELKKQLADLRREQAQLNEKLGEKHPDMVKIVTAVDATEARLRSEIGKVIAVIRSEHDAAAAQEQQLTAVLEAQKQEALALNRRAINYGVLERDAASNRQVFDSLLQRMKEAGIADGLKATDIRIVDRAEVPRGPMSTARGNLLISFLFGSMLAIGVAFLLEYVDSTVKSPEDIREHLHLPFLGMLPVLSLGSDAEPPLVNNGVPGHYKEAFQAVRTNVLFSATDDGPKTLVVTSTQPNEGKSVVATNLAISFGQLGMRVLVVDTDMRRPSLHRMLHIDRSPGLSDILAGVTPPSRAVHKTGAANVWAIPAGQMPSNPAVLLQSKRFKELIAKSAGAFDWVIVDSPPVMPVTDATIVASQVAGVLFVVGSDMTSRYAAMNALNQLQHARAGFVGAVLNRVDVVKHAYYYSNYYSPKHASYYESATS